MIVKFEKIFNELAATLYNNSDDFNRFIKEAQRIYDRIKFQLQCDESDFSTWLDQMPKCASFVHQIYSQMPQQFELFLPVRFPYKLKPCFHESQRSVKLIKPKSKYYTHHAFFYSYALNAKHINLHLQRDLEKVFKQLQTHQGLWGAKYNLEYTPLCYNGVPFAHQIYAREYGANCRGICMDFILAVEFDGAEVPLPAYFNANIGQKWLAYGRLPNIDSDNGYDWAVVLPHWRTKDGCVNFLTHNTMQMLRRMLYSQKCFTLATPFFIKLGFMMTAMDNGWDYHNMSAAELLLTVLGHLIFRNYSEQVKLATSGFLNVVTLGMLRKHQIIGKEIFVVLSLARSTNQIDSLLLEKFLLFKYKIDDILEESDTDDDDSLTDPSSDSDEETFSCEEETCSCEHEDCSCEKEDSDDEYYDDDDDFEFEDEEDEEEDDEDNKSQAVEEKHIMEKKKRRNTI